VWLKRSPSMEAQIPRPPTTALTKTAVDPGQ